MSEAVNKNFYNLGNVLEEVLKIKNSKSKCSVLEDKRKYVSLLFVYIKEVNRLVKYQLRTGREKLHREKKLVDSNRLRLQNLLYEVNHINREIRHCYSFKSCDKQIDLLQESEYYALLRSQNSAKAGFAKRLVRLELELSLRKQLSVYCKELLNSRKQILDDIGVKVERTKSFAPSLKTLLKATKPLQNALQLSLERKWKLNQMVQLLPLPLYLAYMNIYALRMKIENDLSVIVTDSRYHGHQTECTSQVVTSKTSKNNCKDIIETDRVESNGEQSCKALEPNPLVVRFSVKNAKNPDSCIAVNVRYFQQLGFVTATTVINPEECEGITGEVPSFQDILKHVFESDTGEIIPVCGAEHQLKKLNMSVEDCIEYLKAKKFGLPYRWLQKMCGIEVSYPFQKEIVDIRYQSAVADIVKRIQSIWSSRLNLINQIKMLLNKKVEFYLKDEDFLAIKPSCSFVQWTSITWKEYLSNHTKQYVDEGLVGMSDLFYRAVVVRGSAKMECLISVSNKFPMESPFWVIFVHWNGQHSALNNTAIKLMEHWTNSLEQSQLDSKEALLPAQLVRTLYSFDIFLETESPLYTPIEYNKKQPYLKAFSKRMRARPFRCIKGGNVCSFKQ